MRVRVFPARHRLQWLKAVEFSDASREALLRLVRHLPNENDLTLLVLKGHLVVEQQLRDIVNQRAPGTEVDKIARVNFWKLTRVARAYARRRASDQPMCALSKGTPFVSLNAPCVCLNRPHTDLRRSIRGQPAFAQRIRRSLTLASGLR